MQAVVVAIGARNNRNVGFGNGVGPENERYLNADRRSISDRSQCRICTTHCCRMSWILWRHSDYHPFQQLNPIVGLEHSIRNECEVARCCESRINRTGWRFRHHAPERITDSVAPPSATQRSLRARQVLAGIGIDTNDVAHIEEVGHRHDQAGLGGGGLEDVRHRRGLQSGRGVGDFQIDRLG